MLAYAARRLMVAIPVIIGVLIIVFVLLQLTPGDPIQTIVGQYPVPPAYRAALTQKYHLADPAWKQFYYFLGNLVHGELGYSFANHENVSSLILDRLPNTLILTVCGYVVGIIGGTLVGIVSAITRHKTVDFGLTTLTLSAYAIPSFWLGQLLVIGFAIHLGWLPIQGMAPVVSDATGFSWFLERLSYLVLPMLTYAAYEGARTARLTRIGVLETYGRGYIETARMKGLTEPQIIRRHVLRNSMLPVTTTLGYSFAIAMGGSVLIETVFSWPGIGLLLINAIRQRDNQVVIGVVLLVAVMVVIMNLLVDLAYGWLDPRVQYARS